MADTTNPSYVEQVQSNIPAWMQPYAAQLLGSIFGGKDPTTGQFSPGLMGLGYQPYMVPKRDAQGNIVKDAQGQPVLVAGQRTAEFTPLQQAAFNRLAGMGVSPELLKASQAAQDVISGAGAAGKYTPTAQQNFYTDQAMSMAAPKDVGAERFGTEQMQQYMSPYMQGVVEQQKRGAVQDYMRQLPGMSAAAARAGARGGTREALLQAEAQRNLQSQLQGIEAGGLQSAYQQAAQQFGADRAAQMQAALANQQMGFNVGQTNLQAALQNAAQRAQYGLAGANLAEQSRQFGAGLGLQGLQQQLAAAGALGGLGMQGYQQRMGINQALLGAGGQQQALNQQMLNQQYQDFINQQQFPYKQAEFGMGILRGLPATGQTSTMYQQPGSLFGQVAGVAGGIGSLFGGLGG